MSVHLTAVIITVLIVVGFVVFPRPFFRATLKLGAWIAGDDDYIPGFSYWEEWWYGLMFLMTLALVLMMVWLIYIGIVALLM